MQLNVDGASLPIAQLGPDFLILAESMEGALQHGEIVLRVDSAEERWKVDLPHGLAAAGQRMPIVNRA